MGWIAELQRKYDKPNGKAKALINLAIREELVGGDDLLDAMELVDRLAHRLDSHGVAGAATAQAALDQLQELRDLQANIIIDRYSGDQHDS